MEFPADDWVQSRRQCINMVLGTDLKKHFDIMSRFQVGLSASLTCFTSTIGDSRDVGQEQHFV